MILSQSATLANLAPKNDALGSKKLVFWAPFWHLFDILGHLSSHFFSKRPRKRGRAREGRKAEKRGRATWRSAAEGLLVWGAGKSVFSERSVNKH